MRALVTNDDGVESEGLRALARAATQVGLAVTVAAPSWDSSGASASLTAVERDGRVLVDERDWEDLPAARVYGVDAAPGFIARMGVRGAFGLTPQVVLSGVNAGPNTGHAVLHSGTVGAALTAATHECRAVAVSLDVGGPRHWETATAVARVVIPCALDAEPATVLNVNVPNVPLSELRGIRSADLARFGAVQTTVTEVGQGYVQLGYHDVEAEHEPGTDAALVAAGYATVTPLLPVCEAVRWTPRTSCAPPTSCGMMVCSTAGRI
jgi:5'-nucleotidase